MPQVTNRSLIGQMAASPTGPGTVYSAMLKARATNQERVTRVNKSEKMRLQKVKRVMDRNSRHAQWQSDHQMEQLRQSLVKLDAFRRVLQDDFPVGNFLRQGRSHHNSTQSKPSPIHGKPMADMAQENSKSKPGEKSDTNIEEDRHNRNLRQDSNVREASPFHTKTRPPDERIARDRSRVKTGNSGEKDSKRVFFLETCDRSSTEKLKTESHKNSDRNKSKSHNSPPSFTVQITPNHDVSSQWLVPSMTSTAASNRIETCLEERRRLRMERQIERKKRMEEKIVWRGFNMHTLEHEVHRKMRSMDPKRQRKKVHGQMTAFSRQENERIIANSRERFTNTVMPDKQTGPPLSTQPDGQDVDHQEPVSESCGQAEPVCQEIQQAPNPLLHKIALF